MDKRSKNITFTLVGHAHIDPVWLWDWREGYETVKGTFRSALDRIKENPDMVFAHSSASHYAWMENHPSMLAEIKEAVGKGNWEPVSGWWVEPDVNIPSGEALARQGLYGQRYFQKTLGRRSRVAFLPDTFGHPGTLPQIFKQAGLDYFVFMRPDRNELDIPSNLFLWEGPDGSRVLAARIETYNTNPVFVQMSLERNLDWRPEDVTTWVHLYGVGNHGGGPTKKSIASIREANADPNWPTLKMGSLESFFDFNANSGRNHPVVAHELQHHARGCYSAYSPIKTLNRKSEEALVAAEKWAVLGSLYGGKYPTDQLTHAWHQLLFNQFHDILAGSSIESAYEDSKNELGETLAIAGRAQYAGLQTIASRIDTRRGEHEVEAPIRRVRWTMNDWTVDLGDGVPVVVFNPSSWTRTEMVEVELNDWGAPEILVTDDKNQPQVHQMGRPESVTGARPRVMFMAEVPPMGYRTYRITDETADLPEAANPLIAEVDKLENKWWKITFDPASGTIKSLFDKEKNLELMAGGGAQLLAIDDPTDTWGHNMVSMRNVVGVFEDPELELVEAGPLRATVRISTSYGFSTARQEISIYRDTPAINGHLTVDWQEQHQALKLAFPFALSDTTATYSVPYGHTSRPTDGQEEPLQQWSDVTGSVRDKRGNRHPYGVALLNDCKYAGDVNGGEMRLTVLRSPVFAHHDPSKLQEDVLYPYQDQGEQSMKWAIVPHAGTWQEGGVVRAAHDLNAPMPFIREFAHDGDLPKVASMVTLDFPEQMLVSALKQAEDSDDLVLRMYEPNGANAKVKVEIPLVNASFTVEATPHQIKSYRISRKGEVREVNFLEEA